jgi:hypothetical protein
MTAIFALLLLVSSPDAATNATPTEAPAKPLKAKKICRAGAETGSRLSSKICKTQAEWDSQQGADAAKTSRDRGV